MKRILTLSMILCAAFAVAQTEGVVVYEEIFEMETPEIHLDGGDSTMMSAMEERVMAMMANMPAIKKELIFTATKSLYHDFEEKKEQQFTESNENGNVMVIMETPEDIFYTDIQNGQSIEQRDLMGKKFLIDEKIEKSTWKLKGETKEILGYTCSKAVSKQDTSELVAWFTPQIPVSTGPLGSGQLPGLILELVLPNNELTLTAVEVNLDKVDSNLIVAPEKGKKVSRKKYEQIAEAKEKEMQQQYGGEDGVFIKIDERRD